MLVLMELNTTTLAIFAVFAVMGLVGVIAITTLEAAQPPARGCEFNPGGNASKLRCVH
jgi:hypothetical protein